MCEAVPGRFDWTFSLTLDGLRVVKASLLLLLVVVVVLEGC